MFALAEKLKVLHPRYLKRWLSCSELTDWMAYYEAKAEMAKEPDESGGVESLDQPMSETEISDNLMRWKAFADAKAGRGGIQ